MRWSRPDLDAVLVFDALLVRHAAGGRGATAWGLPSSGPVRNMLQRAEWSAHARAVFDSGVTLRWLTLPGLTKR